MRKSLLTSPNDIEQDHITVHGVYRMHVHNDDLYIYDGMPRSEIPTRIIEKSDRTITRIVVIGTHGEITHEVFPWLRGVGKSMYFLADTPLEPGRPPEWVVTNSSVNAFKDARLLRAQAVAAYTKTGLDITRLLLEIKLTGQADVLRSLGLCNEAAFIESHIKEFGRASLKSCRSIEGECAKFYFTAWRDLPIRFSGPVRDSWLQFDSRYSPLAGNSARTARNPINAMLNYAYAILESETILACYKMGINPMLGILHDDYQGRPSMAHDWMEIGRPLVDQKIIEFLDTTTFAPRGSFVQTPQGVCRLHDSVTVPLAAAVRSIIPACYPTWEHVTHIIAESADKPVKLRTPLTSNNRKRANGVQV